MTIEELRTEAEKLGYKLVPKYNNHKVIMKKCPICGRVPHARADYHWCEGRNDLKMFKWLYPDGKLTWTCMGKVECRRCKIAVETSEDEWFSNKIDAENAARSKWNKYVELYELFLKGDSCDV